MEKTVGVISLGCSKNRVDTELMLGILQGQGYRIVNDPARARVLIVNTCGFIESAKDESIQTILELADYKQSGVCERLLVTGCLSQRYGEELLREMPEIDGMLGVGQYHLLPELLRETPPAGALLSPCQDLWEGPRVLTTPAYSAYIKIGDGCDNRCSYCAIPLIRGSYRSRPEASILGEARALLEQGVREISLISQDTTRYGTDLGPGQSRLATLMRTLAREMEGAPDPLWLRVMYCYPSRVDEALLDTLASSPVIAPYLDLPIQHINDRLLAAMHRQGTAAQIRQVIEGCRRRGLTLRTSVIVGFPGESEADFEELLSFLAWARFDRLGAFAFSAEEDTPAYDMPGQIDEETKQRRLDAVMRQQQGISLAAGQARLGEEALVLVEGTHQGQAYGRSLREAPEIDGKIFFAPKGIVSPGDFVPVRLTRAEPYDLMGDML